MDPYYMFHGTETKGADLFQEGHLLGQVSRPVIDAGSSLQIVNHFNQTGSGFDLKRITQAGAGEWGDSWILLGHREPLNMADVEAGTFRLRMDIGSRQWGGMSWELDLNIGRFDIESGSHDGEISWDLRRAQSAPANKSGPQGRADPSNHAPGGQGHERDADSESGR